MKYLGLDIGGSKIAAVVMDEQGHEWKRFRVETRENRPGSSLSQRWWR